MRKKLLFLLAAASVLLGAGVAGAAHVTEADPATVPTGFLAAHNAIRDISSTARASLQRVAHPGELDAFVQHARLGPDTPTGWHTHPGPAVVTVVKGELVYEAAQGQACGQRTYRAGQGFVDPGFGNVHRAIAGPEGVDFYVTYLLPAGSATHVTPAHPPAECAS